MPIHFDAPTKTFKLDKPEKKAPKEDPNRIYIEAVEKDLSGRFGRKVTITSGGDVEFQELEAAGDVDIMAETYVDMMKQ